MQRRSDFLKGYYSILQYVPDPERAEAVNIGIVLFCRERNFLKAKTTKDHARVIRFFGESPGLDLQRLTIFKQAFEERIAAEGIQTLAAFQRFVDTRANQLRLIAPRPLKMAEPEEELAHLFALLVEVPQPATDTAENLAAA